MTYGPMIACGLLAVAAAVAGSPWIALWLLLAAFCFLPVS